MSDSSLPGQVEEKEMQEMEKGATDGPISAPSQSDVISTHNILASMPSKTSQWSMSMHRRGRSARHRSARSARGTRPALLDVEGQGQDDEADLLAEEIAEGKMAVRDLAKPMDAKREML
ncbi:hypothetical protein Bbelb_297100 [Branchiostoma belcheri]|nr:hypothetical protein Bbelb_297100 [Branchiostoma belcheri]